MQALGAYLTLTSVVGILLYFSECVCITNSERLLVSGGATEEREIREKQVRDLRKEGEDQYTIRKGFDEYSS